MLDHRRPARPLPATMAKISELLASAEARDAPYYAIEFFPPRTEEGVANLYKRCVRFAEQRALRARARGARVHVVVVGVVVGLGVGVWGGGGPSSGGSSGVRMCARAPPLSLPPPPAPQPACARAAPHPPRCRPAVR